MLKFGRVAANLREWSNTAVPVVLQSGERLLNVAQ